MASQQKLDPLREFLDAVVTRIEALETHCGIRGGAAATVTSSSSHGASMQKTPSVRHLSGSGDNPSLKAFDKFINTSVYGLGDVCDDLGGMKETGKLIVEVFEGMRYVLILADRSKKPEDMADLQPHLKAITDPVAQLRAIRLDRKYDNHTKALNEMLACVSWVTMGSPVPFVKECIGSSEFWTNRIRKDFKGKEDEEAKHNIAFCDSMKKCLGDLLAFIEEYHKMGLTYNPKGVSLAEAAVRLTDNPLKDAAAEAATKQAQKSHKKNTLIGNTVKGGNSMGFMAELANKRNADGSSAATGLKHVTKDKQTWRKEFKEGDPTSPKPKPKAVVQAPPKAAAKKTKKKGLPILEYQERGTKWVIENQTKETAAQMSESGIIMVDVADPKQQVYIFNCDECTIKINGAKLKSVIVDTCTKVNVIFDTIISGCELVNSKKIAVQSDGVCPVFTIDKTVGVTVWLSEESAAISNFTTSMSSEMNVSIPEGDDRKEMPIPEQFVHKISAGSLTSEVSDLYH